MNSLRRLYWGETKIDFIGRARTWFTISGVLLAVAVAALVFRGLDFSLEFTGGTAWVVEAKGFTIDDAEGTIAAFDLGSDVKVQEVGESSVRVESKEVTPDEANEVSAALAEAAGVPVEEVSKQSTGPSWGGSVSRKAIQALVVFLVLAVVYISLRFEFKMAMTAIAELAHDLVLIVGVYALLGFAVSPATVIAILTMLGYSLYDAVVVFDKVRENEPLLASGKYTYSAIVNRSMNQVLARSVATSFTSFLPAASLLFVGSYVLGASTLQDLSLALVVGIMSGTYSSIFFASPILATWKEREPRYRRTKERVTRRKPAAGPARRSGQKPRKPEKVAEEAKSVRESEPAASDSGKDREPAAAGAGVSPDSRNAKAEAKKTRKHGRQTSTSRKKR